MKCGHGDLQSNTDSLRFLSLYSLHFCQTHSVDLTNDLPVHKMARVHPLKLAHERLGKNLTRTVKILSSQKKKIENKKSQVQHI